jgi:hypothetical protein
MNIARNGSAKNPQTSFDVRDTMKDMTTLSGVAPANPGTGPDASSPNPLEGQSRPKLLNKQGSTLAPAWDMKDGMGEQLDDTIGGAVMDEGELAAKL